MVGKLNILKEKQHKTKEEEEKRKEKKNKKPHPLVRLKNKIITHLGSWKTNKQTNKQTKTKQLAAKNSTQLPCPLKSK